MNEIPSLLDELTSGDDQRAEIAVANIASLAERQKSGLVSALHALLASASGEERVDDRWWALRALVEIQDPRVPPLMVAALEDENVSVRQCAALGLRLQPDSRAIPDLVTALGDEDHLCASLAADALATIGAPAVPDLLEVVQNGGQGARLEAIRALATIGDQRSIPLLFSLLDGESALMEYWANEGLERMGVGMVFFKP